MTCFRDLFNSIFLFYFNIIPVFYEIVTNNLFLNFWLNSQTGYNEFRKISFVHELAEIISMK